MTEKPIPIDLVPYAATLGGAREFLRLWSRDDGPVTCFVKPRALGSDPALFGIAMVDAARHAAASWAKATGIAEDRALDRILEGFDAERAAPASEPPLPLAAAGKED